ncbi:hypothetical protein BK645_10130 [Pseudomonas protegens]|uniref:hypothetical protein n=1 Tax=Pseudomonas protegens TaxID=380021 RepID=UPI000370CF99|nr:hypothetical protein [Pseudomonas protegens]ROM29318.1 hypothetical protein BK645_10130 [Pseudomonas protegens]ROM36951.1 hypothetical protein BK646_18175 [Pseudomonas protegens]
MSDKMREEFEEWAWKRFGDVFWYGIERAHVFMRSGDRYHTEFLNTRWESWQASRESMVVELPKDHEFHSPSGMRRGCREALESLGLRVKS